MKNSTKEIIQDFSKRYPDLKSCLNDISSAIELIVSTYKVNGKLLVCGNGGSASDSLHIVGELMKSFKKKRKMDKETFDNLNTLFPCDSNDFFNTIEGTLQAISLVNEVSLLTAFSNDKNSKYVFAQQVYGHGNRNDTLLAISTSGNSENVILASKMAKAKGLKILGLTGMKNSELSEIADISIKVPSNEVYEIQEYHLPIYHVICLALENEFF